MDDPGRLYLYSNKKSARNDAAASGSGPKNPHVQQSSAKRPASLRSGLRKGKSIPLGSAGSQNLVVSDAPSTPEEPWSVPSDHPAAAASASEQHNTHLGRWEAALGNLADAGVALQQMKHAVDDAVYLDEDAYDGVASLSQYAKTIKAQQRRIVELEHELDIALGAAEKAEACAREEARQRREAEARTESIETELENNAVVFKMHYNELLARNDEVEKLKAVIEGLSGAS
mmetsp:Transcript_32731/g.92843  ORF Transcript_32731/g.92843 Transcript_32731/m.92843 type:complete len:230 (-) Transcript_32731:202-891(-)